MNINKYINNDKYKDRTAIRYRMYNKIINADIWKLSNFYLKRAVCKYLF